MQRPNKSARVVRVHAWSEPTESTQASPLMFWMFMAALMLCLVSNAMMN